MGVSVAPAALRESVLSRPARVALLLWLTLLVVAVFWGNLLNATHAGIKLNAPPFQGSYEWRLTWRVMAPVAFGAAASLWLPAAARRLPWRHLVVLLSVVAALWALALAYVGGWDSLTNPVTRETEYLAALSQVGGPGPFLNNFVASLTHYPLHVQGHPPGFVLLLWSLNMLGLRGTGWVAAIEIAGGAAMVAAAVIAVRELAGDPAARAASPFVALAPSAIWVATSADAFFGGVSAWGVALFVLASNREGGRSVVYALAAGMLLGCALHLSYATLLLGLIVIAVGVVRGSWQAMLVAACGLAAVAAAFYAGGFWWFAGLAATLARYRAGVASTRPFAYFALSNLAAFGAALGPAVAVGLARLRDRRAWLLVGPALMAVAVANLSGLSKGEVERIWLPFTPWLLIAGCALPPGSQALWLAIQALVAVAIQTAVRTPW